MKYGSARRAYPVITNTGTILCGHSQPRACRTTWSHMPAALPVGADSTSDISSTGMLSMSASNVVWPALQPYTLSGSPLAHFSGMTINVNNVDTITPNINEIAMPWKIGSVRITLEPNTKAKAVIKIGRVRARHASITASCTGMPAATARLEKSANKIELRTIMPASAIKPIIDVAVNSAPNNQ